MANSYNATEFGTVYDSVSAGIIKANGIYDTVKNDLLKEFEEGGLSLEKRSEILSKFFIDTYASMESQAIKASVSILESQASEDKIAASITKTNAETAAITTKTADDTAIAAKELDILDAKLVTAAKDDLIKDKQKLKVEAETANTKKNTELITSQKAKVIAETGIIADRNTAEVAKITADKLNVEKNTELTSSQKLKIDAETATISDRSTAEIAKLTADTANIGKNSTLLEKQALKVVEDIGLSVSDET